MAPNDHNDEKPNGHNATLQPSNESGAEGQGDPEKHAVPTPDGHQDKEDPFGDETNAEVKYRTMEWW